MGIFGFGKKKEEKCNYGGGMSIPQMPKAEKGASLEKSIIVLGTGCAKCHEQTAITQNALNSLNIDEKVEHITDLQTIAAYGIMTTPALVIDNVLVGSGKVFKEDEVISAIKQIRG